MPVEQSAQIEAPEAFDPHSFRRHTIAPGVVLILAKRSDAGPTETQAIRFDADQGWTQTKAKRWTKRHGYTVKKWSVAFPADALVPTPNACKTANPNVPPHQLRGIATQLEVYANALSRRGLELQSAGASPVDEPVRTIDAVRGGIGKLARELRYASGERTTNPDDSAARLHITEAAAHLREAGAALDATNPAPAITPGAIVAAGVATHALTAANPPKPRQLVQIGFIRGLEFADGRLISWSVRERWPLLADPGAEKGSAGRTRLYTLAGGNAASDHDPHKSSTRTFETWHDFDPRRTYTLDVPLSDEFGTALGDVVSIVYRSDKWQAGRFVDYQHDFSRPYPRADAVGTREQPRAIQLSGGKFRLTARGLVG